MWESFVYVVPHPNLVRNDLGEKAIVICNVLEDQPFLALVTALPISADTEIKSVPYGSKLVGEALALNLRLARIAAKYLARILRTTSLQPWPCCSNCYNYLSVGPRLNTKCGKCGLENDWKDDYSKLSRYAVVTINVQKAMV